MVQVLGAAIAILLGVSSFFISLFSFIFGIITIFLTIFLSKIFKNLSSLFTLILSGIIISSFMAACLSLIKYLANYNTTLPAITFWLLGSFENSTFKNVYILLPIVIFSIIILLVISWRINIVSLGKEEAISRGLNYRVYRIVIILIATLLTASSVAFSGIISWVGLIIPHFVRLIIGRNAKKSIILNALFGGTFMVIVDIFSRSITSSEIPLSAITGFFGSIIFVIILATKRRNFYETIGN
ncbi:FecCD family ABC transporter permease [Metamycoplasma buccale]|uniref:FecCD family ABC transporter permease n=1 Tax=Metamycoplasma buccale TaxID=55602 RepID=UPI00398E3BED